MKKFWCGAVVPNCNARFQGESEADILAQVAAHAAKDHGMTEVPASVVQRVRELIQDAS